jgi:hypothetical protein
MLLQKDKVSAVVTIVNFLLMSAGSQREWVAEDVDLEALEPEELDVLQLVVNWGTMQGALDHSPVDDLAVCTAVLSLMRRDYIRLV